MGKSRGAGDGNCHPLHRGGASPPQICTPCTVRTPRRCWEHSTLFLNKGISCWCVAALACLLCVEQPPSLVHHRTDVSSSRSGGEATRRRVVLAAAVGSMDDNVAPEETTTSRGETQPRRGKRPGDKLSETEGTQDAKRKKGMTRGGKSHIEVKEDEQQQRQQCQRPNGCAPAGDEEAQASASVPATVVPKTAMDNAETKNQTEEMASPGSRTTAVKDASVKEETANEGTEEGAMKPGGNDGGWATVRSAAGRSDGKSRDKGALDGVGGGGDDETDLLPLFGELVDPAAISVGSTTDLDDEETDTASDGLEMPLLDCKPDNAEEPYRVRTLDSKGWGLASSHVECKSEAVDGGHVPAQMTTTAEETEVGKPGETVSLNQRWTCEPSARGSWMLGALYKPRQILSGGKRWSRLEKFASKGSSLQDSDCMTEPGEGSTSKNEGEVNTTSSVEEEEARQQRRRCFYDEVRSLRPSTRCFSNFMRQEAADLMSSGENRGASEAVKRVHEKMDTLRKLCATWKRAIYSDCEADETWNEQTGRGGSGRGRAGRGRAGRGRAGRGRAGGGWTERGGTELGGTELGGTERGRTGRGRTGRGRTGRGRTGRGVTRRRSCQEQELNAKHTVKEEQEEQQTGHPEQDVLSRQWGVQTSSERKYRGRRPRAKSEEPMTLQQKIKEEDTMEMGNTNGGVRHRRRTAKIRQRRQKSRAAQQTAAQLQPQEQEVKQERNSDEENNGLKRTPDMPVLTAEHLDAGEGLVSRVRTPDVPALETEDLRVDKSVVTSSQAPEVPVLTAKDLYADETLSTSEEAKPTDDEEEERVLDLGEPTWWWDPLLSLLPEDLREQREEEKWRRLSTKTQPTAAENSGKRGRAQREARKTKREHTKTAPTRRVLPLQGGEATGDPGHKDQKSLCDFDEGQAGEGTSRGLVQHSRDAPNTLERGKRNRPKLVRQERVVSYDEQPLSAPLAESGEQLSTGTDQSFLSNSELGRRVPQQQLEERWTHRGGQHVQQQRKREGQRHGGGESGRAGSRKNKTSATRRYVRTYPRTTQRLLARHLMAKPQARRFAVGLLEKQQQRQQRQKHLLDLLERRLRLRQRSHEWLKQIQQRQGDLGVARGAVTENSGEEKQARSRGALDVQRDENGRGIGFDPRPAATSQTKVRQERRKTEKQRRRSAAESQQEQQQRVVGSSEQTNSVLQLMNPQAMANWIVEALWDRMKGSSQGWSGRLSEQQQQDEQETAQQSVTASLVGAPFGDRGLSAGPADLRSGEQSRPQSPPIEPELSGQQPRLEPSGLRFSSTVEGAPEPMFQAEELQEPQQQQRFEGEELAHLQQGVPEQTRQTLLPEQPQQTPAEMVAPQMQQQQLAYPYQNATGDAVASLPFQTLFGQKVEHEQEQRYFVHPHEQEQQVITPSWPAPVPDPTSLPMGTRISSHGVTQFQQVLPQQTLLGGFFPTNLPPQTQQAPLPTLAGPPHPASSSLQPLQPPEPPQQQQQQYSLLQAHTDMPPVMRQSSSSSTSSPEVQLSQYASPAHTDLPSVKRQSSSSSASTSEVQLSQYASPAHTDLPSVMRQPSSSSAFPPQVQLSRYVSQAHTVLGTVMRRSSSSSGPPPEVRLSQYVLPPDQQGGSQTPAPDEFPEFLSNPSLPTGSLSHGAADGVESSSSSSFFPQQQQHLQFPQAQQAMAPPSFSPSAVLGAWQTPPAQHQQRQQVLLPSQDASRQLAPQLSLPFRARRRPTVLPQHPQAPQSSGGTGETWERQMQGNELPAQLSRASHRAPLDSQSASIDASGPQQFQQPPFQHMPSSSVTQHGGSFQPGSHSYQHSGRTTQQQRRQILSASRRIFAPSVRAVVAHAGAGGASEAGDFTSLAYPGDNGQAPPRRLQAVEPGDAPAEEAKDQQTRELNGRQKRRLAELENEVVAGGISVLRRLTPDLQASPLAAANTNSAEEAKLNKADEGLTERQMLLKTVACFRTVEKHFTTRREKYIALVEREAPNLGMREDEFLRLLFYGAWVACYSNVKEQQLQHLLDGGLSEEDELLLLRRTEETPARFSRKQHTLTEEVIRKFARKHPADDAKVNGTLGMIYSVLVVGGLFVCLLVLHRTYVSRRGGKSGDTKQKISDVARQCEVELSHRRARSACAVEVN